MSINGHKMTTESLKLDKVVPDDESQQHDLTSSIEDKHFDVKNEKANYHINSGSDMHDITKDLISKESGNDDALSSESVTKTSAIGTKVNIECNIDDTEKKNVKSVNENTESNSNPDTENNDGVANIDVDSHVKEYDASIDDHLPESVTLLTTPDGGKLYLIGTVHFSLESQNDVSKIIQAVQPHVVTIELCKDRIGILEIDEQALYNYSQNLSYRCIFSTFKENGAYNGLLYILLLNMVSYIAKELGMGPGGEFRRAFKEAEKVPHCIIHMADRPINITIQRALRYLSWWQTIHLGWYLITMRSPISKEEIELCKEKALMQEIIADISKTFPALGKVFIEERDTYLTYSLQLACLPKHTPDGVKPARVVGIVGAGHTPGIIRKWGTVKSDDISPIMSIPPLSLSSRILRFTFKASLVGAAIYVGYKIIPLRSMKPWVEGLLKIMVSMDATAYTDEYVHSVFDIMYVVTNIPGPGANMNDFESEYSSGCSCTLKCSDCSCTRGSANYTGGGCIADEKLAGPILECNSHCLCEENCGNRLVQYGPSNGLVVSNIDGKGLGLITTKFIKKGQFICEYAGEVIGIEEARRRVEANKRDNSMNYVLVVSEHIGEKVIVTCIDPKYFGNIGRYSNHSCQPNGNLIPVRIEGVIPRLCLFACRDIESGEEVTFNYANGVANSVHCLSDTVCLCGSSNCLGYLPHNPI